MTSTTVTTTSSNTATNDTMATKLQAMREKMSPKELKRLMKEYGPIALAFHSAVWLSTLGAFYSVVDYGFDIASLVGRVPIIAENMPHAGAGNLAVAWGLTTVTGPVRGIMTITLTPPLANFWWGRDAKRKLKTGVSTINSATTSTKEKKRRKGTG